MEKKLLYFDVSISEMGNGGGDGNPFLDSEQGWCPCQGRMSDRGEVAEPGVVLHGVRQQGLRPEHQVPAARGCAGAERSARSLSRGPPI